MFWRVLSVSLLLFLLFSSSVAQQVEGEKTVRGRGFLPASEPSADLDKALDAAIRDAVLKACAALKGESWTALKSDRIASDLLPRAWDFIREYRVVAKSKSARGFVVVVDAHIFWDRLSDALALLELPKLPPVRVSIDGPVPEGEWTGELVLGVRRGFEARGFEVVGEEQREGTLDVAISFLEGNKIGLRLMREPGEPFEREFELTDESRLRPYDTGLALARIFVQRLAEEGIVLETYEFVVAVSGVRSYADVAGFVRQLKLLGAVRAVPCEAGRGRIAFRVVAVRPKGEVLGRLIARGFKVGAE